MKGIQIEQIILLLIFVIVPVWRVIKNWLHQRAEALASQNEPVRSLPEQSQVEPADPFERPPAEAPKPKPKPKPKHVGSAKSATSSGQNAMNRKAEKARDDARPRRKHVTLEAAPLSRNSLRGSVRYALHDADRLKHAFALSVVLGPPRGLDPPQSDA